MSSLFEVDANATPSHLKQRSISENSVHILLLSTSGATFVDSFDLSALNFAIAKIEELKAQMQNKWAFLKELEVSLQFKIII